jgi:hypothetical protein
LRTYNGEKVAGEPQGRVIFTCKDATHPWLRETVADSEAEELICREWNGRNHMVRTYR